MEKPTFCRIYKKHKNEIFNLLERKKNKSCFMLSDDDIFVKLTRKCCSEPKIKFEVIKLRNPIINEFEICSAISQLIKNGNVKHNIRSGVGINGNWWRCDICKADLENFNLYDLKSIKIKYCLTYNPDSTLFAFGNCVEKIYLIFNEVVDKLGREEFKKLYYKLFIFLHRENMIFDVYCKIGQKLFDIYCK